MSETKTTRKQLPAYLILALIALAAALLLAVTNAITAGPIKAHEEAAQNAAFQSVMEADSFSTMSIPDGCNVTSLVEAKKDGKTIGYCAVSSAKGYGGNVAVTLGVDMDGKIVGCQIGDTNFAETDGFGARWKEPARAEAFIGLSAFGGDTQSFTARGQKASREAKLQRITKILAVAIGVIAIAMAIIS